MSNIKLTTSTRLVEKLCPRFTKELDIIAAYGFEGADYDINYMLSEKVGPDWRRRAEAAGKKAEKLGLVIGQTHLPAVNLSGDTSKADEAMRQAIEATAIMGTKYAVFHAANPPRAEDGYSETERVYGKHIEYASKLGVEMLVEIMPGFCRYPITAEALIDCADGLGIGICWDFGHAGVMTVDSPVPEPLDQGGDLRRIGKRLKAVHIHDNAGGVYDEHLPPYMGLINWDASVPALKEIGYAGNLNYEVLVRLAPAETIDYVAKYLVCVGEKLKKLMG